MGRLEGEAAVVNRRGAGEGRPGVVFLTSNVASYHVGRISGPNGGNVTL
jgi:hypothetical protein